MNPIVPPLPLIDMPHLLRVFLSPFLLSISVSLSLFAAITTALAFSTLLLRALLVYAELGAVLIRNQFVSQHVDRKDAASAKVPSAVVEGKQPRHNRRNSAASGSNARPSTPRNPDTGLGTSSGGGILRDFEGVGGWFVSPG